jgi:hypothetical protein
VSAEDIHRQRMSALPLLLFAGIDLVIALVLLVGSGLTAGFWAIFLIGMALAGTGLWKLYRRPPE